MSTMPVPGWYADPHDAHQLRYWDGGQWTAATRPWADQPTGDPRTSAWATTVVPEQAAATSGGPGAQELASAGRPWWQRKRFAVLAVVLMLAAAGHAANGDDRPVRNAQPLSGTATPAAAAPAATTSAAEPVQSAPPAKTAQQTSPAPATPTPRRTSPPRPTSRPKQHVTTSATRVAPLVPEAAPRQPAGVHYAGCAAVRAAGKAPLHRGDPGFRAGLDRDGDGVACEPYGGGAREAQPTVAPRPLVGGGDVYYANCTAVRDAGKAPLHPGDPGYRDALDRDHDGSACE
ncbi:excalibur calcium-binding domain-containing protein [Luteipulveratus flavus]|uniref:Excalibur calcium-binding domain-containing protein n=1 Tax=Luteipulveratus flavus TaxID=3031728 RepID=A0ABT6C8H3_9MICO|nr:excalibur calcium-binding domain-containing protein [Luteipulveratus sp. YIM 133296]MDF8265231.1 excalibur calcium-binding domain-containing protein [Luteipulveratus sp. YIM 133296]